MKTREKFKNNKSQMQQFGLRWILSVAVITLVLISCKTEISENKLADIHGPSVVSTNPSENQDTYYLVSG